ncbi:MAG: hypothetical protein HY898_04255 [Deltaproteobacteria bacterium]|nr:hypothetical protein [Deltaproteobacteria bacterium]
MPSGGTIGSCKVFPATDPWNRDVSADPVDPSSDAIIAYINSHGGSKLHPDFGSDFGIPYTTVTGSQPKVDMTFDYESDPGPYPIPPNAPVEAGGDAHVLVIDTDNCMLYETFASQFVNPGWQCGSGAVFDLKTGFRGTRTSYIDCWTSADAAGLPIFPGLVRYDEVKAGAINHAIRVTFSDTRQAFVHPATHFASSDTGADVPPMGMRLRMKASFDISGFTGQSKVVVEALKKYGFINADNGSNWFFQGAPDPSFDDEDLNQLKAIPGTAFEVVQMGQIYTAADCP